MAGHAQLKFVMTECSKTQIRLTGLLIFINDMPFHLQTDMDIYADDTITHTAGKKNWKWLNLSYKTVQGTLIHGVSNRIWGFIMIKHIHS